MGRIFVRHNNKLSYFAGTKGEADYELVSDIDINKIRLEKITQRKYNKYYDKK